MHGLTWLVVVAVSFVCMTGACGGVYITPPVNMPALRTRNQAQLGVSARTISPQSGLSGLGAYAITDLARVGATATRSFPAGTYRRGTYGELLAGVEPVLRSSLQYGILGAAGYGRAEARHKPCPAPGEDPSDEGFCFVPSDIVSQVRASYGRYTLQGYLVYRAPRVMSGGAGLRAGVTDLRVTRIDDAPATRRELFGTIEPFLVLRAGWPRFQVELQYRYVALVGAPRTDGARLVVPEHFMINAGVRFVLGPVASIL
jgi:hypothetical protein